MLAVETVGRRPHDAVVHHPWRLIRDLLPDWHVAFEPLPDTVFGDTDTTARTIRIDNRLTQRQRRSTAEHERIHARDGDTGCQPNARERQVEVEAARNLISLDALVDACLWAHDVEELADECWVDQQTMQTRLDTLHDDERLIIRRALAQRDYHEEGL